MVQLITQGIKVSVETKFEGSIIKDQVVHYAFKYTVNIQNQSNDVVQLKSRFWKIKDSLNHDESVNGQGVIGKKPVLQPGESHMYSSGCLLQSPLGAMRGHYDMVNFTSSKKFRVYIPTFKLSAPFALN
ncbi:Co2+/Mg2+ efflux protein ApaG [Patiriisocius hiemis]|uniref:Co2+/Mg2+ efflux protein ApaG n=1 Tax=Patiriisocius hiemis TaxID=3075604 RepID=A0ABU2YHG3_9FLAO|nr:Co2+/Mg2+ efflux protein ApaG [Constantimarinum sp. W242]MDT0556513.1 Co2+/Mg2+ efflux protein ApaG [Constantimarinum sp. W242]